MAPYGGTWLATAARSYDAPPAAPARREAVRALTDEVTAGHVPPRPGAGFWNASSDTPDLGRMLQDVPAMMAHPRVDFSLSMYCGAVAQAEFALEGASSDEAGKFVLAEARRFWQRCLTDAQLSYRTGRLGGELVYTDEEGPLQIDYLKPLAGAIALVRGKDYYGVRSRSSHGTSDLAGPSWMPAKGFWHSHNSSYHRLYGFPQLYAAWRPWRRLAGRDGTEDGLDGAVYRFGVGSPIGRYPMRDAPTRSDWGVGDQPLSNRERMREMLEYKKAGAPIAFPSTRDEHGQYEWDLDDVASVLDVSSLIENNKDLERQITLGIGVAPELLEASEVGSGYSGRAIPLEAFLVRMRQVAWAMLQSWWWQVGKPLLHWNYGPSAWARLTVLDLLMTRMKAIAKASQPDQQEQGAAPADGRTPVAMPGRPAGAPGQQGGGDAIEQAAAGGEQAAAGLKATVGGSQAIAQLQKDVKAGEVTRDQAIANATIVFGFSQKEAERLFPDMDPGLTRFATDAAQRAVGVPWQGGGDRWFVKRPDGKTVRTRNPNAAQEAPRPRRTPAAGGGGRAPRAPRQAAPDRVAAASALAAISGGNASAESLRQFADNVGAMTIPQLREARRQLSATFGASATRRDQMVERLRSHAQQLLAEPPEEEVIDVTEADVVPDEEPTTPPPAPPEEDDAIGLGAPDDEPVVGAAITNAVDAWPVIQGRVADAVASGSGPARNMLIFGLQDLPLTEQYQIRQAANLPYDAARAAIANPDRYAEALADALIDQASAAAAAAAAAAASAPPGASPWSSPPPPVDRSQPDRPPAGIQGKAADAPELPRNVEILSPNAVHTRRVMLAILGRAVDPMALAGAANAPDGSTVTLESYYADSFSANMRTADGTHAQRTFTRHPDGKVEVHNDIFRVTAGGPLDGHGIDLFLNQVRSLREVGVDFITTHAAGNFMAATSGGFNGYITWPKFGYDGTMRDESIRALPEQLRRQLRGKKNVQALLALPGGEEAWELHGSDIFDGRFDVTEGSDSMKLLDKYLEKRRARPEGGGGRASRDDSSGTPAERRDRRRAELERKMREKMGA